MGLMALWWLLGLVVLVAVVWAVVRAGGTGGIGRGEESPETILKRRYARGDLDCENTSGD